MMLYISSLENQAHNETSVLEDFRPEAVEAADFLRVMAGWL